MYHNIGIPPKGIKFRGLYVLPLMFRFQMWYLKIAGFKVVPLRDIVDFIKGRNSHEKLVAITFDDGYQDFYDKAYPVIRKYHYPATVFIVSGFVGKENLWDYKELNVRKKLLDWNQILELKQNGVDPGGHSKTHPYLSQLSIEELQTEILDSKTTMEEKLKCPVDYFCYPYGDYNEKVVEVVTQAKYQGAVTVQRGFVLQGDNPFEIKRVLIKFNTHPLLFILKLYTSYETRKGLKK